MDLIHAIHEPTGPGPHPTILALHGRGANSLDLLGLAPYLCGGRFLMICPQGPLELPVGPNVTGFAWYPMSLGGPPDTEAMLASGARLESFLDQCVARYPIDTRRLALLGFSQGGVMAYSLALGKPERFTALAALSTWLPAQLAGKLNVSTGVESLPAIVQHGANDSTIPIARARDSVRRLGELKLPLLFKEYEMGHEITPRSLRDLSAWLEEKVLSR